LLEVFGSAQDERTIADAQITVLSSGRHPEQIGQKLPKK
jgi:hypothetical protein